MRHFLQPAFSLDHRRFFCRMHSPGNRGPEMATTTKVLRLGQAPLEHLETSVARFLGFLHCFNDPHVRIRPREVLEGVVRDGSMFFLESSDGELLATTAFYRHGDSPNQWGEIGSTLVNPAYRGARIQPTLYRHIIALEYFSDWPSQSVFAVTDTDARASSTNIQDCRFIQRAEAPLGLIQATPGRDWTVVTDNRKQLYVLDDLGISEALDFVADHGFQHMLTDRDGRPRYWMQVDFIYLREPDALAELRRSATQIRARQPERRYPE